MMLLVKKLKTIENFKKKEKQKNVTLKSKREIMNRLKETKKINEMMS